MSRVIFILAFVAITLSLTKSASVATSPKNDKNEGMTKMMDSGSDKEENPMAMFMDVMSQCNETFTIEMSYIQALNESGSFPDETDRMPKCYVRCLLEKLDVATEDGVYEPSQMAMAMQVIRMSEDEAGFKDMAVQCNDRKETCKCDRAYQYAKCVLQADIKKRS